MSHQVGIFVLERASDRRSIREWLQSIDIEAHNGWGKATFTPHVENALRFPDTASAWACWRAQSKMRPLRDDGRPNRPLTAYTVEIRSL